MIVLLLRNDYLSTVVLPRKVQGQFWLRDEGHISNEEIVAIEGCDGQWILKANKKFKLQNGENRVALEKGIIYHLEDYQRKKVLVFVEDSEFHTHLVKYKVLCQKKEFFFGRQEDNSIVIVHSSISRYHFKLTYIDGLWEITDLQSTNGTFVNQRRIQYAKLKVGDLIYVLGVKIVIGTNFIAINTNSNIIINTNVLEPMKDFNTMSFDNNEKVFPKLFNRLPRRRLMIKENEIKIESPPMSINNNQIPLMLRMGGTMAMGGQTFLSGHYLSLLSTLIFPMLNTKYSEKQKKEYEDKRIKKYNEYLAKKHEEILKEKIEEERVLNYNYPSTYEVLGFANDKKRLWERRNTDDDFLHVRVGVGNISLQAKYRYQEERFNLEDDELEDRMYDLISKKVTLEHVPIMNSFKDDYICGITGNHAASILFVQRLLAQIVMTHSYDEVKIMILLGEPDLENEIMKKYHLRYLPHLWNNQKTIRFIATNASEAFQLGEFLKSEVEVDLIEDRSLTKILKERPYYIIFALNKKIFDSMGFLKDIMQKESNIGVSILTAFDDLPKECTKIFHINSLYKNNQVIHIKDLDKEDLYFDLDSVDFHQLESSMKILSNTHLKIINESYALPKMITFLEMFGVGRIEHLNAIQRWKENNPVNSLSTPIGVGTDGTLFELDLHQKYQGPHGLIAGMTGSGKSELIITYILSMAINYHPDEVSFLIIDYKGGGVAGAFEDETRNICLPHLIGTITNLDGNMIQRSLMSIESELIRRQKLFNDVKKATGEASIDIYSYQSLYRRRIITEPLPHLFIIADEFAELKQQQPEFMEQLISAARIGRSLGIHLILATQKPSGIVNDQIRSNTKFRICLKVQDKTDSMDMLKRGEAAELKETGRFYLQVGYNEYFALGQSAWCGATYEPQDEVVHEKDIRIQFIDHIGQTIVEAKETFERKNSGRSQLSSIVAYLSDLAKKERFKLRKLCLPPLTSRIDINEIPFEKKPDTMSIPLGIVDNPREQYQQPYYYDFQNGHHLMIIGDAKSGKTTLVQTMIYMLVRNYSPRDVNFYILDYSSRLLRIFKELPHCGEILIEDDEQQIPYFFKLIEEILIDRKKLFEDIGVDSFKAARKIKKIPIILVIIDNLAGMSSSKICDSYVYRLSEMLKAGMNYGIKYIITVNYLNEANMRLKQELLDRITFHMKDVYDYSEALSLRCRYAPSTLQGRGMIVYNEEALEWHAGMYKPFENDEVRWKHLKKEIHKISSLYKTDIKAKSFIKIPDEQEYEDFANQFNLERIPLGYSLLEAKPIALPLRQFSKLAVYFGNEEGKEAILKNILYAVQRENANLNIVLSKKNSTFSDRKKTDNALKSSYDVCFFDTEDKELLNLFYKLAPELKLRKQMLEEYCNRKGLNFESTSIERLTYDYMQKNTQPIFVLFERFLDMCMNINDKIIEGYKAYFQVAKRYNVYFIGCFYPDDAAQLTSNSFYESFLSEKFIILFGGNYHKQGLIPNLPVDFYKVNTKIPFNKNIMFYRGKIYSMIMPIGSLREEILHEDELSIF